MLCMGQIFIGEYVGWKGPGMKLSSKMQVWSWIAAMHKPALTVRIAGVSSTPTSEAAERYLRDQLLRKKKVTLKQ